jgi:hypothetical protein
VLQKKIKLTVFSGVIDRIAVKISDSKSIKLSNNMTSGDMIKQVDLIKNNSIFFFKESGTHSYHHGFN